jgi:hypothetical protein
MENPQQRHRRASACQYFIARIDRFRKEAISSARLCETWRGWLRPGDGQSHPPRRRDHGGMGSTPSHTQSCGEFEPRSIYLTFYCSLTYQGEVIKPSQLGGPVAHRPQSSFALPPHSPAAIRNYENYLRKCFLILRLLDQSRQACMAAMKAQPPSTVATPAAMMKNKTSTQSVPCPGIGQAPCAV